MTKARDLANASTALSAVSATELGYLDGVTSAVQTQIDGKQAANANVSTTELGYLDGVTSAIQTQLNAKVSTAGGSTITASGASVIPLVLQGAASQTGDLLQIKNSAGTALVLVQADGTFRAKDPLITRSDSTSEGGQLNLARAVDNTAAWAVDNVGTTSATTFRVVNLTAGTAPLTIDSTGSTIVNNTYISNGAVRNIFMSTSDPSGGSSGDVWIKYTP